MAGFNKSAFAFDDLREVFEKAMAAERGIKIICKSRSEAVVMRSRMNYLRKMDRKENGITYQSDSPMHMRSIWDRLTLRIPAKGSPEENILFVEKRSAINMVIEEISPDSIESIEK